MRNVILVIFVLFVGSIQAAWKTVNVTWLPRRAIVLKMADSYQEAEALAREASKTLQLEMNERNLNWNEERDILTFTEDDCQARGFGAHPCYQARGIEDWLGYISIEEAKAYENLPDGKFAVMVGVFQHNNKEYETVLEKARSAYPKVMDLEIKVFTGVLSQQLESF